MNLLETEKKSAAKEAVRYLQNNMVVGLGTGSTADYAVKEVGELVKLGLQIKAVSTSVRTTQLADSLNIPLIDIHSVDVIDITIDGTDEFTQDLLLLKGGGGALYREKMVASITKKEIIIADSSKLVKKLGKFKLPVEIIPSSYYRIVNRLEDLKGHVFLRKIKDDPFITEQGNHIIDVDFGLINDPASLSATLDRIDGIVAHGLFIRLADKIIMAKGSELQVFTK